MSQFNNRIRQVLLMLLIGFLAFLIIRELYIFLPGFMGALTFYILGRERYFRLTEKKGMKPGLVASIMILLFFLLIATPLYYAIVLVTPKVSSVFSHTDELFIGLKALAEKIKKLTGQDVLSLDNIKSFQANLSSYIPTFLNSTATILSNLIVMFFVLFFMLTGSRKMEDVVLGFIPLHSESIKALAVETKNMVKANAIGIPLISLIQGITAFVGYKLFGLSDALMWGFLTGIFAFFPIIGTMMIWVPLVVYLFSQGLNVQASGLMIYSLIITGNVDYLARVTLMKKIGNVHPLITIFGVIIGLQLFGFMGFIFGPLIFSYFIVLIKIYAHEFVDPNKNI
jgi:predicted PurR-regulated permease PerM